MAKLSRYCKAYPIIRLSEFYDWALRSENARTERRLVEGKELQVPRSFSDNDFLYVQEDFTVTDGVYIDENVVFDRVTPEWVEFCTTILKFEAPVS
jgi:hypothetical protein